MALFVNKLKIFGNLSKPINKCVRLQGYGTTKETEGIISNNLSKKMPVVEKVDEKAEKISKAMHAFLQHSITHENLMVEKESEFEIGKRHLIKMMGLDDKKDLTAQQIEKAIKYLLPSNLYNKQSRPFMKPPREYYPKVKALEFDRDGRPHHYLFYTGSPKTYELFANICERITRLNNIEDNLKGLKQIKDTNVINSKTSKWISENDLSKKIGETIETENYEKFKNLMNNLINHPLAIKEKDYIFQYREEMTSGFQMNIKKTLLLDVDNRKYQEKMAKCRTACVKLKLYGEGTGTIKITTPEGTFDINYFSELKHREQLLFPFKIVDGINKYDIDMKCNVSGMSCIARATRHAISHALCSFVPADKIEKLRIAGLLTTDIRVKERKKYGQEGARKKFTWKKR